MKRLKILVVVIVVVILVGAVLIALYGRQVFDQYYVAPQIERAACVQNEECVPLGDYCSFGCNVRVRASQADRIRGLIEIGDEHNCNIDCPYIPN